MERSGHDSKQTSELSIRNEGGDRVRQDGLKYGVGKGATTDAPTGNLGLSPCPYNYLSGTFTVQTADCFQTLFSNRKGPPDQNSSE